MGKRIKFIQGLFMGMAAQYYYDPQSGAGRRARLRDQAASRMKKLGKQMGKKAKYQVGKSRGFAHRLTSSVNSRIGS